MTKFLGRRGALGIAIESSKGVPVAPTYWLPRVSLSFFDTIASAAESQALGNIADQDSFYVTGQMGEGDVDSQLYDIGLGYILSSLLGAKPSSGGSNPTTHTFALSQTNVVQTLSLYFQDPNISYMFANAVAESVKLTITPNGIVNWTIHFKSKKSKDWTRLTPDFTTLGNKFLHQHLQFRVASNIAGLAAATKIRLKNLELTINRNSIFDSQLGTVEPTDILSQSISVEGQLKLNNEDSTWHDYMMNGSYKAMEIKLLKDSNTSLVLQFPRVNFSQWQPDYSPNDISTQQINLKANYDSANALDIISTATLINGKSSY